MTRKLSRQAVEILRATLKKVEEDPDLGEESPTVSDFKRIVLNRVAEMEEPPISPPEKPAESAVSIAVALAAALVAEPVEVQAKPALDPNLDPSINPALATAEVTPLLADAASNPPTAIDTAQPDSKH